MPITANDILYKDVHVHIQYIDSDKTTVLHENIFNGRVEKIDDAEGIVIKIQGDTPSIRVIPPSLDACFRDSNDIYHLQWSVFRTQTNRADGQHEWWEWKPRLR